MDNANKNGQADITSPPGRTHKFLAGLLALFVVAKIILVFILPRPSVSASDLTIDNILQAVNKQRQARDLVSLNSDSRLSVAAQSKADDMQARHYFAHVDPDGNYIWPKIVAAGYTPYLQLGENLAIEFYDTESLVAAWMNSPTHRANILNDGFKDQGMGLNFGDASAGQYHSIVANTFGTLLVKKARAQTPPAESQATPSPAASPNPAPAILPPKPKPSPKPPIEPNPAPPAPPPAPAVAATTSPAAAPQTPPTSTPANLPAETKENPVSPRGGYAMAQNPAATGTQTPAPAATNQTSTPATTETSAPAVVNPNPVSPLQNYQTNRYFTLAFGIALFLFLITDLRGLLIKKSELVSKKIGNLALLFLALVVVAIMYWM